MPRPQNSPRGLFSKSVLGVGSATLSADSTGNVKASGGIKVSNGLSTLTGNSTGNLVLSGGVKLNNVQTLKSNSTGSLVVGAPLAAKPSNDQGVAFGIVSNTTGVGIVVNSTGTTWKWLSTTATQPT